MKDGKRLSKGVNLLVLALLFVGSAASDDGTSYKSASTADYVFVVDEAQSYLTVNMTVRTLGGSFHDADTSPVSGWISADVTPPDSRISPFSAMRITDLELDVSEQIDLAYSFVSVTVDDISLDMNQSGPEVPVSGDGTFLQTDCSIVTQWTVTVFVSFDHTDEVETDLAGSIEQSGDTISLTFDFGGESSLDSTHFPALVQSVEMSYSATIVATVQCMSSDVSVPNVVGLSQSDAESALVSAGLVVGAVGEVGSDTVPLGHVISQSPVAGSQVAAGSAVDLVVSSGPSGGDQVQVPDVVGMSLSDAQAAMASVGLVVGTEWYQSSETVPEGHVIGQDPGAGTSLPVGSPVDLFISSGPPVAWRVPVPDVVGAVFSEAVLSLQLVGLSVGDISQAQSDTIPEGCVTSQYPAAGTEVALGSTVDLVVSSGPRGEVIPPPAARWRLDETAGPAAYDCSGSSLHGALFGNPTWQPEGGQIDGALRFDGYNDYVELPIGPLLPSLTDSTFATWVNWSGTGGDWQRIFDFGSGETINMFLTPSRDADGPMCFAITTGGNGDEDRTTAVEALASGWHHVAVTIDPNSHAYVLYLDGQVVARNTGARYTPSMLGMTTQNWLGRSQYPADGYYGGMLDDFQIYDYALSETEIDAAMQASFTDVIFNDAFETPHDYLTDGLGAYDGMLNGSVLALDANDTRGGALYMETGNNQWEPGPGPLLYVNVVGDFVATVKVTDFAGTLAAPLLHNAAGILARDPAGDGGAENWVSINYFPTWTGFVAWDTVQGFRIERGEVASRWTGADTYALAEQYPYIQLERVGQDFYFRISADGVDFIPLTDPGYQGIYDGSQVPLVVSRPDLPATLQVGLHHATSSPAVGYAAFDEFRIARRAVEP